MNQIISATYTSSGLSTGAIYAISIIGSLIFLALIPLFVRLPAMLLANKFKKLGTLTGKSYKEIAAAVGAENSHSAIAGGSIRQWIRVGLHIALRFDENDVCLGVTHETAV